MTTASILAFFSSGLRGLACGDEIGCPSVDTVAGLASRSFRFLSIDSFAA